MNSKRLLELAEIIEGKEHGPVYNAFEGFDSLEDPSLFEVPESFNMTAYHCESVACVCGWAISLWGEDERFNGSQDYTNAARWGAQLLDLERDVAFALFDPQGSTELGAGPVLENSRVTPEAAASVLRRVAAESPEDGRAVIGIWRREMGMEAW